jgi:dynein heavy chain
MRQLEERRLHLVNAEILFDLPITDYSRYIKCRSDMEGLEQIYSLYKQQKASTDFHYSCVLNSLLKLNNSILF